MERLGRYRLRRRIETSSASVVYLVRDSAVDRDVVVKMLPLLSSNGASQTHRSEEKDRPAALVGVEHRNLVPIEEIFEEIGLLWLVMEYVPGRPLETLLFEETFFQRGRIQSILQQMADCLDYAHQKGVIHGRLTPSKVMVREDGTVRILGFGFRGKAETAGIEVQPHLQQSYLAPEQTEGAAGDERSDQYTLATIAYRMLTGVEPGAGIGHRRLASLDPAVGAILHKGLADQPEQRYRSCIEFVDSLEKALDKAPALPWLKGRFPGQSVLSKSNDARAGDRDDGSRLFPAETGPASMFNRAVWLWLVLGIVAGSIAAYTFFPKQNAGTVAPQAPFIAATTVPSAKIGAPYNFQFSVTDGTVERWAVRDGTLPANLVLSTEGTLRGIPAVAGMFPVTVEAKLTSGEAVAKAIFLEIGSDLEITTSAALPTAVVGLDYYHALDAKDVEWPWNWSLVEGSLPPDLALDPSTGRITGVPSQTGEFSFRVAVTDASSAMARQAFELTVDSGRRLSIAGSIPGGIVGRDYSHRLAGTGGTPPYTWLLVSGSWPPGLSMDSSGGRIRGTPTRPGSYRVTLRVADAKQITATRGLTLNVAPSVHFTAGPELPEGQAGSAYASRLAASGGRPPFRWRVVGGTVPDGLALDSSSGIMKGTATSGGTFEFTAEVMDSTTETVARTFQLRLNTPLVVATSPRLPDAEAQARYALELQVSKGTPPYRWELVDGEIPPGLRLEILNGRLAGTPRNAGQHRFTLRVTDSGELSTTRAFDLSVQESVQLPEDLQPAPATAGETYSFQFRTAGGTPPYTWSVTSGALPPGLSLRPETGELVGTPSEPGSYQFSLSASSGLQGTASQEFQLSVAPPRSGQIVWSGRLESDRVLTIQNGEFPSTGTLTDRLPGGPIEVQVEPEGVTVVEAPNAANGWGILVIHAGGSPRSRIRINWTRME